MITRAAIRWDGLVYTMPRPNRHHNIFWWLSDIGFKYDVDKGEQGFLDDKGNFLSREAAEAHARACEQLDKPLIGGVFTSEDLW